MLILDGGMGTILRDRFNNNDRLLWSLMPYFKNKNDIIKSHKIFLDSGADIIITNNYCATPYYFNKAKLDIKLLPNIIKNIGLLAKESIKNYKKKYIFGSIPPYGGSYNKDIKYDKEIIINHYHITCENLINIVDKFIFETVCSLYNLYIILEFIEKYNIKNVYISFCVNNTGEELLDKTNLKFIIEIIKIHNIKYIFFNCSPINYIDKAIKYISNSKINIGVYPNKHKCTLNNFNLNDDFNKTDIYTDITQNQFLEYAKNWQNLGVSIIGGCCGIDEKYISKLKYFKISKL